MYLEQPVTSKTTEEQDWSVVLDAYGVQFLALDVCADYGLLLLFRSDPRWRMVFENEEAVLLERVTSGQAAAYG